MKRQIANIVYIIQNLAVPILVFVFVTRDLAGLAYLVVIASKWRVVAVNPRFWIANLRSNSCDIIIGLSTVALMSSSPVNSLLGVNLLLAFLYGVWLVAIKPRSGRAIIGLQAFLCQLYGLTTLYLLLDFAITSFTWVVIILAWLVARASARHFLSGYKDDDVKDKAVIIELWSFLVAQFAWVFWVWNVIYVLPGSVFALPLIGLVVSAVAYVAGATFNESQKGKLEKRFVTQQVIFLSAVLLLVIVFTRWTGQV